MTVHNIHNPQSNFFKTHSLAYLSRTEEARAALDECVRIQPDFFASGVELCPYDDPAGNKQILDGLPIAGWEG